MNARKLLGTRYRARLLVCARRLVLSSLAAANALTFETPGRCALDVRHREQLFENLKHAHRFVEAM